jgi:hypothetical protein
LADGRYEFEPPYCNKSATIASEFLRAENDDSTLIHARILLDLHEPSDLKAPLLRKCGRCWFRWFANQFPAAVGHVWKITIVIFKPEMGLHPTEARVIITEAFTLHTQ